MEVKGKSSPAKGFCRCLGSCPHQEELCHRATPPCEKFQDIYSPAEQPGESESGGMTTVSATGLNMQGTKCPVDYEYLLKLAIQLK